MLELNDGKIYCAGCREEIKENSKNLEKELDDEIFLKDIQLKTIKEDIRHFQLLLNRAIKKVREEEMTLKDIKLNRAKLTKIQVILDAKNVHEVL